MEGTGREGQEEDGRGWRRVYIGGGWKRVKNGLHRRRRMEGVEQGLHSIRGGWKGWRRVYIGRGGWKGWRRDDLRARGRFKKGEGRGKNIFHRSSSTPISTFTLFPHCTLFIVPCTLYTVHCTLYNLIYLLNKY